MKLLQLISLSTVIIHVNSSPISFFNLFKKSDELEELSTGPITPQRNESFVLNGTNSTTGSTGQNSTNSTSSTSNSKPNILLYSFSNDFTKLYESNSSSTNSNLSISAAELSNILYNSNQGTNGNSTAQNSNFQSTILKNSLSKIANISYQDISNVSSSDFNSTYLLKLYYTLNETIESNPPDGIVILQDFSNIETSAFFLDLVLNSSIPIILTTEPTSQNFLTNGVSNLYDSVLVATNSSDFVNQGTLVVSDKKITSGFYSIPVSTNLGNSIDSSPQGLLGQIYEGKIQWFYESIDLTSDFNFTFTKETDSLPNILILENGQGRLNLEIIDFLEQNDDLSGLIITSQTSTPEFNSQIQDKISELSKKIPVVITTDTPNGGSISPNDLSLGSTIAGGILDSVKAKVLLQLCVNSKYDLDEIKHNFESAYGG
ncbi:Glutamyl-tRNA(Gln) amidotransferase subunit D [Wickerhamomyces ciferrii]|uniref:asparaginase n=1 Tax=Wickerhamomyces ciferrii (strain ATCC 14091 / BCRC 22168 / CBS 111 / JCM 3599 / NBRC 0793 / NRRL Y-1031 F-60-10) TaxID=1206466 RepID=K0KG84_WICCF|nr:Glutamyl-tRNA(Gln) amidotransferase subunit D [Wickerhamomyces ciferrii]CCH41197.1 Glutamyl-tRNA(Gln) amidotransferase subunit D [Wickerhamomyces ciferrii]